MWCAGFLPILKIKLILRTIGIFNKVFELPHIGKEFVLCQFPIAAFVTDAIKGIVTFLKVEAKSAIVPGIRASFQCANNAHKPGITDRHIHKAISSSSHFVTPHLVNRIPANDGPAPDPGMIDSSAFDALKSRSAKPDRISRPLASVLLKLDR